MTRAHHLAAYRWRCRLCTTGFGFKPTDQAATKAFENHYIAYHLVKESK